MCVCVPPMVNHRERGALLMASVVSWCNEAEMEGIIAEMLFFLLRICWDVISGTRRR